ncbi:MAG: type VI secretion system contractile sheath large subunit [Acidobacteriia bacterium]|nr:type VI secretion system contractile sheath large subunit [Terriglobia bacterium]
MNQDHGKGGVKHVEAGFGASGESLPDMPLKVVVFAELTPRDPRTGQSTERRRRVPVDRGSFDEVLKGFDLHALVDVPDRLGSAAEPRIVDVAIGDLKAFRPEALAEAIPAAHDLLRLRAALGELKSARLRLDDVRSLAGSLESRSAVLERVRSALLEAEPAAAPQAPARVQEGGLDALLEKVALPEGEPSGRGADLDRLDALVRDLARSSRGSDHADPRAVEGAIREIDAALSAQVDALLHHPEIRRLEAVWRGLKLLIDRTDFDKSIRIDVIACGREQILSAFDDLVVVPESQGISSEPVSFVVVDLEFDRTPADIEILEGLAQRGAALSAPVITGVGVGFLGLSKAGDLARMPGLKDRFGSPEYTKWRGLREAGASRWLGAAFNRILLRPAYAPGEWGDRAFGYRERLEGGADEPRVWGSAVWAVAVLAVRSFGRIGWCTDMMGQRASGTVDDLPVRLYDRPGGEAVSFPLETSLSDDVERDLTANGVMAITSPLDSDRAFLRFAPSVHAPQHYQDPVDRARAKLQSTLPFQMFVGRLLNYAMAVEGLLVPGRNADQIASGYDRALRSLLGSAGRPEPDAVKVAVLPNEQDPSTSDLYLKVRWPGSQSLPGAGEVELRWPLQI